MLSGIGPAAHLRDVGIDVLVDAPGVGQNLHDHPVCWITYGAAAALPSTTGAPHVLLRSGATVDPDIQIGFAPVVIGPRWTHRPEPGFSLLFSLMSPTSRGSVQLSGPDPNDRLLIDPACFAQAEDLNRMAIGLQRAREIADAKALTPWRGEPIEPAFGTSDENACRAYIRASAGPYFHPVGHLPHRYRRIGRRRPVVECQGGRWPADRGRIGNADDRFRQHKRHRAGNRREGRDADFPRREAVAIDACAVFRHTTMVSRMGSARIASLDEPAGQGQHALRRRPLISAWPRDLAVGQQLTRVRFSRVACIALSWRGSEDTSPVARQSDKQERRSTTENAVL